MISLKIAVTTIAWGKIKSSRKFREVLRSIRDVGYDGVGIETRLLPNELLKEPNLIPKLLEEVGLENAGAYSRLSIDDLEWARKSETRLLWLVPRGKDCNAVKISLAEFADKAEEYGIVPALHNHLRTCFETEDEIRTVLKEIPKLRLCFDTAHGKAAGIDLIGFIREFHDKISLVHLKDLREDLPKYKVRFKRDFVNVGKGIIRFDEILKEFISRNYERYVMLEIEALNADPATEVTDGYKYIRNVLRSLGKE